MVWSDGPLVLYHGTDDSSATKISAGGVDLSVCTAYTDFGPGFYTTTNLDQAKNWANTRCRKLNAKVPPPAPPARATVLQFDVDRNQIANLDTLCFILENSNPEFWDFIRLCRTVRYPDHRRRRPATTPPLPAASVAYYDVIYGLVSLWPQTLVIKDCDQVSFHTDNAKYILPRPLTPAVQGNPYL